MNARPEIEGSASIRSPAERFFLAFQRRVVSGLLTGQPHPRSNYVVSKAGADHLEVRAADWWSAVNVGLNRVELRSQWPDLILYKVQYWQWASYVLCLSGGLGLFGIVLLLSLDVRGYMARHQDSMIPGMSIDQNLLVAWLMVLLWGFVWPWLLISLHKRPLHRLVTNLIGAVDADANSQKVGSS